MRARSRASAAPRRRLVWARDPATATSINVPAAGSAVIDMLARFRTEYGGATPLGCTVTRCRLDVQFVWPVGVTSQGSMQLGVIVDQALSAAHPLSEVPDPAVEIHADWMYSRSYFAAPAGDSAQPASNPLFSTHEIDIRAQRKMEELGESLFLVVHNSSTVTVAFNSSTGVLLKLP